MCRVAVIQELESIGAPATHAEIADRVVPKGFDRASIYRCLIELADTGLLRRLELGDHLWRFELRYEESADDGEHSHFLCTDCGQVSCVPDLRTTAAAALAKNRSAAGEVTEVLIRGRCRKCA
jgi:Fur family ferric uptake transcriptional regulator